MGYESIEFPRVTLKRVQFVAGPKDGDTEFHPEPLRENILIPHFGSFLANMIGIMSDEPPGLKASFYQLQMFMVDEHYRVWKYIWCGDRSFGFQDGGTV